MTKDKEGTKRLVTILPEDTHRNFKLLCTERDVKMSDVIFNFVTKLVEAWKNENK